MVINCLLSSLPNPSQCNLDNLESRVHTINDDVRPYKNQLFSHFLLGTSLLHLTAPPLPFLAMSDCLFCLIPSTFNVLRASFSPQL